jgi:tetratricopeptide (TPR) repeat protein
MDLQAGQYEVALQRFQYILERDPSYPGAAEQLAAAMQVIYATSTPTPPPPTATPTPTRDLRPVEDQLTNAKSLFDSQDWPSAIDALVTLRKIDPVFQVTIIDRLLYAALRNWGVNQILVEGHLESGTYDLALAENFGPLDVEASQARDLARLYVIGLSFWEVHPEQAVYYFGQVASAAPFLHDGAGWSAKERYREALVQYGDLLASKGEWCNAFEQYQLALALIADETLNQKARQAAEKCAPATPTPQPTITLGATATLTPPAPPIFTLTPTQAVPPSFTPTVPVPVITDTPMPTPTVPLSPPPPTDTVGPPPIEPTATTGRGGQ